MAVSSNALGQLNSVHLWHDDIGDEQIDRLRFRFRAPPKAARRQARSPCAAEHPLDQPRNLRIVVHD